MNTLLSKRTTGRAIGRTADTDGWVGLVQQIAELEEILQEAAASPDQDAFGERAALERLLMARRQALRDLDVAMVVSERGARQPVGRRRCWRAEGA